MKPKLLLSLALVLSGGLDVVHADVIPGADWHVANAKVIELVQAEMPVSVESFPPPPDRERVWVKDVLKGVDTTQVFLLPKDTLKPGQSALVLFQYEHPAHYEPALQTSREALAGETQPEISVWPMDSADNVDTHDIPAQTQGGPSIERETGGINLNLIKKDIATSTPEQVGLNRQVLDALLFPDKFQALARTDASRATYVRFTITILDLNRDVSSLARLLESQDQTVRTAASEKLEVLTGTHIPTPKDNSSSSLHEWAQTWAQQAVSNKSLRWPPVPADLKAPPDAFPEPLIEALQRDDDDAFTKAFVVWLDSGVMRDREIRFAANLDRKIVEGSNLGGAIGQGGPYLPPAPRLRPDVVLDTNIPAIDRMKAIALLVQLSHYDRFAQERAEAVALVATSPNDSDILHRAAFWELRDPNIKTAGRVALNKLAQSGEDESSQRFILGLCLDHMDDDAVDAVRVEIKAGRQTFIDGLFAGLGNHKDHDAQIIARLLCQEKQERIIPIMSGWMKDNDAQVRKAAAFNLCWFPSAHTVSNLLDAIHSESDSEVKSQMLVALAQTGDKRGLETLLAAAREPYDSQVTAEIVRGLGRIGDDKALTTLADIASQLAWITKENSQSENSRVPAGSLYLLTDTVNAFGYISHLYEAHIPDSFQSSVGINLIQVEQEIELVEQWRKSQVSKP
jgi:HEAT repeat protein